MTPRQGEVWAVDFSPSVGSEIRNVHPALVVSDDRLNESAWGLIVVLPITTFRKEKPFRLHVLATPPEGGLKSQSVIHCDQVKSVSVERFIKRWGTISVETMEKTREILRRILTL